MKKQVLLLVVFLIACQNLQSQQFYFNQKISALLPNQFSFSTSYSPMAMHGNVAVIGLPGYKDSFHSTILSGAAQVFILDDSTNTWSLFQTLTPDDAATNDNFGWSVGVYENTIVVSATGKSVTLNYGSYEGVVYIFERQSNGFWKQSQRLISDQPMRYSYFGYSLAIDSGTLIIGSPREDPDLTTNTNYLGVLYIFTFQSDKWILSQKLIPNNQGQDLNYFGQAVDISSNLMVIGFLLSTPDIGIDRHQYIRRAGLAQVYRKSDSNIWQWDATLIANDAQKNAAFGASVAIDKNRIIIGAPLYDIADSVSLENAGAAYIYEANETNQWVQKQQIFSSSPFERQFFAGSVAIDRNHIAIGVNSFNNAHTTGKISLFSIKNSKKYKSLQTITINDGSVDDKFGQGIALSNGRLATGIQLPIIDSMDNNWVHYPTFAYFYKSCESYKEIAVNECYQYTAPSGTQQWTTSGIYFDTLTNAKGCDSILTIHLNINANSTQLKITACQQFVLPGNLEVITKSGKYIDTLVNSKGCDSIISFDITIGQPSSTVAEIITCRPWPIPNGSGYYTESGIYKDRLQSYTGCDSLVTTNLAIIEKPTIDLGDDFNLCANQSKLFRVDLPLGFQVIWNDSSTAHTYTVDKTKMVWVVARRGNCTAGDTVQVVMSENDSCDCHLFVPNSFTPFPKDGSNDVFKPIANCALVDYHFTVFDRWGEIVFTSNSSKQSWDGTKNGAAMSLGVYYYIIDSKTEFGKILSAHGTITLLR